MTETFRPLADLLTEGHKTPRGYDRLLLKATRPDLRTRNGFRWTIKGRVESPAPAEGQDRTSDVCPQFPGDGLSLAKTAEGMAQGGYSPSTVLVVAVRECEVMAEDEDKVKVLGCLVVDLIDGLRLIREKGAGLDLTRANLTRADLYGATLSRANLTRADLYGATLSRANLYGADLYGATLSRANLYGADLYGANLYGANLTGANLTWANLTRANLTWANLYGADLTGANLDEATLNSATADRRTIWPDGFNPEQAGVTIR